MRILQAIKIISQNRPGQDIKEVVLSESEKWDNNMHDFSEFDMAVSKVYLYFIFTRG